MDNTFRIHPAIGMARVGNSEEYLLAPETMAGRPVREGSAETGGLPIKPGTEADTIRSSDLRDEFGALKRQPPASASFTTPAARARRGPPGRAPR
jgi:hypothetical protein